MAITVASELICPPFIGAELGSPRVLLALAAPKDAWLLAPVILLDVALLLLALLAEFMLLVCWVEGVTGVFIGIIRSGHFQEWRGGKKTR